MKLDLLISGNAGQGVVTLARIVTRAALDEGFDAHFMSHSGIAQLDGSVMAHVRVGSPAGPSPRIPRGSADAVIGLDRLEALRAQPYLASGGTAFISDYLLRPMDARSGEGKYPELADVEAAYAPQRIIWVPAAEVVEEVGHRAIGGAVCLGAMCAALPVVDRDHIIERLRREVPDEIADAEVEAFFRGYSFFTGHDE